MDLDCLGEEIRVLYVALTRAKEKLIMTAFCSDLSRDLQKALGRLPLFASSGALLPYSTRSRAMSFFDLILPAVIRHPAFRAVIEKYELDTDEFDAYRDISAAVPLCVTEIGEKDLKEEMVTSAASGILRLEELKSAVLAAPEGDLYKRLTERFTAKYPHENLKGLFTKTTVSELKKAAIEKIKESREQAEYAAGGKDVDVVGIDKDENQALVADKRLMLDSANILELDEDAMAEAAWFAESEGYTGKPHLKGAERGTAYHRVMELLDGDIYGDEDLMNRAIDEAGQDSIVDQAIDEDGHRGMTKTFSNVSGKEEDNLVGDGNKGIRNEGHGDMKLGAAARRIYAWIKGMEQKGRIAEEAGDCVWTPDVVKFLASDVGQRMGRAFRRGDLSREKPFMMGVSAKELDDRFPEDEMVLVQGIIDAFFIEDGEIVLLDYKTDRVPDDQTLVDLYKVQLALYKRALEAATGLKVRECLLYSFALGRQIAVEKI
jgi:ATP-dependent helicase/nuclease subunit A